MYPPRTSKLAKRDSDFRKQVSETSFGFFLYFLPKLIWWCSSFVAVYANQGLELDVSVSVYTYVFLSIALCLFFYFNPSTKNLNVLKSLNLSNLTRHKAYQMFYRDWGTQKLCLQSAITAKHLILTKFMPSHANFLFILLGLINHRLSCRNH